MRSWRVRIDTLEDQVTIGAASGTVVAGGADRSRILSPCKIPGPTTPRINAVVSFTLPAHTVYKSIAATGYACTPATGSVGPVTVACIARKCARARAHRTL